MATVSGGISPMGKFHRTICAGETKKKGKNDEIWFYRQLRQVSILSNIGIIIANEGLLIPNLGIVIHNPFVIGCNNS